MNEMLIEEFENLKEFKVDFMGDDRPEYIEYAPIAYKNKKVPFVVYWTDERGELRERDNGKKPNYISYSEKGDIVAYAWLKTGDVSNFTLHRKDGPAIVYPNQNVNQYYIEGKHIRVEEMKEIFNKSEIDFDYEENEEVPIEYFQLFMANKNY